MSWQTILKQGQCYKLSYDWLYKVNEDGSKNIKMAHADVVGTHGEVEGKTYGHAFILLGDDKVLDVCQNTTMDKRVYYDMGQVSNVKEYTVMEAIEMAVKTGNYGPW